VSDRDSRFLNTFWQELFNLAGTELTPSTSYHHKTNEQTEIVNKWVEGYLHHYVFGKQKEWIRWLHLGEYCYNTTHHMSIRMSPFMALYDYEVPSLLDLEFAESRAPKAKYWIQES
jgi:hypothetical protein